MLKKTLAEFGHVDILVTCVGDSIRKPVVHLPGSDTPGMTEEEWNHVVNINLTEAFQGCRALGHHLLERRQGCVINVSGWASFRGRALSTAYDASKAGVMRFTESLAQEWAPYGIRVNAIAPGSFPDPDQMTAETYQARDEAAKGTVPLGRVGCLKEPGLPGRFPGVSSSGLYHRPDLGRGRRCKHQNSLIRPRLNIPSRAPGRQKPPV